MGAIRARFTRGVKRRVGSYPTTAPNGDGEVQGKVGWNPTPRDRIAGARRLSRPFVAQIAPLQRFARAYAGSRQTPSNSRHSPFDMPEVSCVTTSPLSRRFSTSTALALSVTPPSR